MPTERKLSRGPAHHTIVTKRVERLVRQFEAGTLPRAHWTHQAHVRVGLWYLLSLGLGGAMRRMRRMVRRYNTLTGKTLHERAAYHETITVHWIWTIEMWRRRNSSPGSNWHALFRRLEGDPIMRPERVFRHYSAQVLFSGLAHAEFVAPDITPIPADIAELLARLSARTKIRRIAA